MNLALGDYKVYADFHELYENGRTPFSVNNILHIVDVVIDNDECFTRCGSTNRVPVALDILKSSGSANWKLTPDLPDGARLFASASGGTPQTTLQDMTNVWVSAGNIMTNYTLVASHPNAANIFDSIQVLSYDIWLASSTNCLTLKHDREAYLFTAGSVSSDLFDTYRIEIKRTNEVDWVALSSTQHLIPWRANVAGVFHLRSVATRKSIEYTTTNIIVEVQFPSHEEIEADPYVRDWMETAWQHTLDDCTPGCSDDCPDDCDAHVNRRREQGFWIYLNTTSGYYLKGPTVYGPWRGPTEPEASVVIGETRPDDIPVNIAADASGAIYPVASFHTHPAVEYCFGWEIPYKSVGPSKKYDWWMNGMWQVPGIVYDYLPLHPGGTLIPLGHPKNAPAKLYVTGYERRDHL